MKENLRRVIDDKVLLSNDKVLDGRHIEDIEENVWRNKREAFLLGTKVDIVERYRQISSVCHCPLRKRCYCY